MQLHCLEVDLRGARPLLDDLVLQSNEVLLCCVRLRGVRRGLLASQRRLVRQVPRQLLVALEKRLVDELAQVIGPGGGFFRGADRLDHQLTSAIELVLERLHRPLDPLPADDERHFTFGKGVGDRFTNVGRLFGEGRGAKPEGVCVGFCWHGWTIER